MHILFLHSHPVQYWVPLYRLLAKEEDVKVTVGFFSDHPIRGGLDQSFGQDIKWDVPLLEGYESDFLPNDGPGSPHFGFRSYRSSAIGSYLDRIKPDVIVLPGHGLQIHWQAVREASRRGIPLAIRPESLDGAQRQRGKIKSGIRSLLLKRFYGRIGAFCATGNFSKLDAELFGFKTNTIFRSPYCIDTELFEDGLINVENLRLETRQALGVSPETMVVLFCAKFIDWKNPSLIIDAVAGLKEENRSRIFPLLIGSGPDFEKVVASARKLLGEGNFSCPGFINQSSLPKYYAAADCAVLPSKRGFESWGLVVNEAMTAGLPATVSDGVGCRSDLILSGRTGEIFADGDSGALGRILEKWLLDPSLRKEMGLRARSKISAYSSRQAANGLLEAVRSLCPNKQTTR